MGLHLFANKNESWLEGWGVWSQNTCKIWMRYGMLHREIFKTKIYAGGGG